MADSGSDKVIEVSAVLLRDVAGRILTVRKRGTAMFMMPGGKPEAGESPAQTACREIHEELGIVLEADGLDSWGVFHAAAANESGHRLVAHVFAHPVVGEPSVAAEIEEMRWFTVDAAATDAASAPLLPDHIAPILQARETARGA